MDIQIVSQLRELGISYVGDVPWGTHICAFYQEDQDYIDIVIPYLQAGLTNNELCIWVLPLWLSPAGSISLLQKKYLNSKNIASRSKYILMTNGI